ncbi:MAG: uroporphyrinogen decarboxylase family protein [Oscillospiraceae bacterium]|jgi:uroporphyrinogen decarboxylase|nr:uroporphyrinogen decarboxylase family protein [Oscillospiraceae bacterium]
MTNRERFAKTLRREKVPGRVPTFELQFFLTMEALGRVCPHHMHFSQWAQMQESERRAILDYKADTLLGFAQKYHHSALNLFMDRDLMRRVREKSDYYILAECDPTFSIPDGTRMMEFTERLYEDGAALHREARQRVTDAIAAVHPLAREGLLDGVCMTADYCFNANPYFSPEMFAEFVAPYLKETIAAFHGMGLQVIKHTDGNLMPILDQLVDCAPDALHSLDPQGGVDLSAVSRAWGDRVALCGNVNCALLQTGAQADCAADIRRSLHDGMARGAGYVFCTSNCAYTGLPLERYEFMHDIWWEEGLYSHE